MAHFEIYVPNARRNLPAVLLLDGLGLGGLLRAGDRVPDLVDVAEGSGPDGGRGLIVAWSQGRSPEMLAWNPAAEDALHRLPAGRFSFGFDVRSTVAPSDLQRDEAAFDGGNYATLADGRQWVVPYLQGVFFRATTSRFETESIATAHHLKALAESRRGPEVWDLAELNAAADACADLLSFNYRVNRELCLVLGLFDVPSLEAILGASCRVPLLPCGHLPAAAG